jgi:hypothetical protein
MGVAPMPTMRGRLGEPLAVTLRRCARPILEHAGGVITGGDSAAGTDASQDVGAQEADGEDDNRERHNQVEQVDDDLANLQVRRPDLDGERRHTLFSRHGRGQQRGDNAIGEGAEELGHDTAKVECSCQDDNVACIKHLFCVYILFRYQYNEAPQCGVRLACWETRVLAGV